MGEQTRDLEADELDLRHYLGIVRRRWPWILGVTALAMALVVAFTLTRDETYRSRAEVLLLTDRTTPLFPFPESVASSLVRDPFAEVQYTTAQAYRVASNERAGLSGDVEIELALPEGSNDLAESSVLRMTAHDRSAERAQRSAQAYAETYIEQRQAEDLVSAERALEATQREIDQLTGERRALFDAVRELRADLAVATDATRRAELEQEIIALEAETRPTIDALSAALAAARRTEIDLRSLLLALQNGESGARILNNALANPDPVSPDMQRNVLLALPAALVLGLLAAAVRDYTDRRARDRSRLERMAGVPVLGAIPAKSRRSSGKIARFAELPTDAATAYRAALNSIRLADDGTLDTFTVLRADDAGATLSTVRLAQAEAARGPRVVVIDASFESPALTERLGITADAPGLADLLALRASISSTIHWCHGVDVIGAGQVRADTADHLRSDLFPRLLDRLREAYDLVFVEAAPPASAIDGRLLASRTSGVVVLYDPKRSTSDDVADTVAALRTAQARVLGLLADPARSGSSGTG